MAPGGRLYYSRPTRNGVVPRKAFVGKHRGVLQHQQGAAVSQLASQEPDDSAVFRAWRAEGLGGARLLAWRNKPQTHDPCLASLVHASPVNSAAVSRTRIVGAAGKVVAVYNRETEELLEEFACSSDVRSVAIWENESDRGWIVAGLEDGTIKIWDAGVPNPQQMNLHLRNKN